MFKLNGIKLIPVPSQILIIQVKNNNKIISCSKKISNFVKKWIQNNPQKLNQILTSELGPMLNVRNLNKKTIPVNNNVDKQ